METLLILQQAAIMAALLLYREAVPILWRLHRDQGWRLQIVMDCLPVTVGAIMLGAVPLLAYSPRFARGMEGADDLATYTTRTLATGLLLLVIFAAKHYLRQVRGVSGWAEQAQLLAITLGLSTSLAWIESDYDRIVAAARLYG